MSIVEPFEVAVTPTATGCPRGVEAAEEALHATSARSANARAQITTVLLASTLLTALAIGSLEVVRLLGCWRFGKLERALAVIDDR